MAKKDEEAEGGGESKPAKAKGGSKLPLILAIVVVLAAAGGGGAWFALKGKGGGAGASAHGAAAGGHGATSGGHGAASEASGESGGHGEKGDSEASIASTQTGPMWKMEAFTLNLAAGSAKRVVKIEMELEMRDEAAKKVAESRMAPIRDAVIMYVTGKTDAEVLNDQDQIKQQLQRRINNILGEGAVRKIYFTHLLMQ